MRICARLGGGSTKEPGESRLTEGNEERGKTEIGGRRIKKPAVRQTKAERVIFARSQTEDNIR